MTKTATSIPTIQTFNSDFIVDKSVIKFIPTHRHYKGENYMVIGKGFDTENECTVVIYMNRACEVFVQDKDRFLGMVSIQRFEIV